MSIYNLAQLRKGQQATIRAIADDQISLKLLEMGILPPCKVELTHIAPLGDPICIYVEGSAISLRKSEASLIEVSIEE